MKQIFGSNLAGRLAVAAAGCLGAMLAMSPLSRAEDIDLFVQPPGAAVGIPNVLILLDNTANWSRTVDGQAININELAALVETVENLPVNDDGSATFRVGLMLFTETGRPNSNVDGGYIRAAVRDMTGANKAKYMALLNSLDENDDKSNGGKAGKTFAEAYRYFKGQPPVSGNRKEKTDYESNNSGTAASNAVYALPGNALDAFDGSPYNSPIVDGSCGGNYIIYISNGAVQDNTSDTRTATELLAEAALAEDIDGATATIPVSPSGSQTNIADEWARFLYRSSVNAVTYTVDVDRETNGQGPGWTAILKSIANVSNGKYFDVTAGDGGASIADALGRIFSEIQAVNSVFASVSLPVSVNTEGTYLNQVYIGMFRPDGDAMPRWMGNLKQYKLGINAGMLRTLDADDEPAINSTTGFVTECARTFWTPTTSDGYWAFKPQGSCLAVDNSDDDNFPDGNIVEKGAQAYVLRSSTSRTMKTCTGTCSTLANFNTANASISAAALGAADATERTALINWMRGLDVDNEDLDASTTTEMRPSSHGDVVHSRPVAINFNTDADPEVVVFYGGNDGVLRAVNGNRSVAVGSVSPGEEYWSFVAPEFFGSIKRLRDNIVPISFTGAVVPPVREPKPYGFDGPISVYRDPSTVWIYPTMRRGGRMLYAFDVTDITDGDAGNPVDLLWRKGCPNLADDASCSSGFDAIGQTWSQPRPLKTNGYTTSGQPAPMLFLGGGYDACEDSDPHGCVSGFKGNRVYVLDAATGAILKEFTTDRPVPADVFVIPDGSSGLAKFAYAVDTGGNVYRISGSSANLPFGATDPINWTMTKIASLGCDDTSSCAANRKFLFSPDVVEKDGVYYLLVGSGDREKPIRAFTSALDTENHFYMLKDMPSDPGWLSSESSNCGSDIICLDSLVDIGVGDGTPDASDLAAAKGWYLDLRDGEQVVTSPITVFGIVTFSTHTPTEPVPGACTSNLGTARVYNVRYLNAAPRPGVNNRDQEISGGGLPPSPVAGQVTLDNGVTVPFIIGADASSPLEAALPTGPASGQQPKSLTYWYIEK